MCLKQSLGAPLESWQNLYIPYTGTVLAKPNIDSCVTGQDYRIFAMSDSEGELGLFEEPEGYYQAEKEPTFVTYTLLDGRELNLRLVGHNPLWVGHRHPHPLRGISLDPHVCDTIKRKCRKVPVFQVLASQDSTAA